MADSDLTAEYVRSILDYDPETGVFRWKVSLKGPAKAGNIAGTILPRGYRSIRVCGRGYLAHRLAWLHIMGKWPPEQIDHINHQPDDNRWDNLRAASHTENQQNSRSKKPGVIYKGVRCDHRNPYRPWRARIVINKKETWLGNFATPEEAARAYNDAAVKAFGEFAHLNVISVNFPAVPR